MLSKFPGRPAPGISYAALAMVGLILVPIPALAQDQQDEQAQQDEQNRQAGPAQADVGVGDIIVTAQKRSQSINSVGLTIQAITGDDLLDRGIRDPADLVKAVPGFGFTSTDTGAPVYTLRGVGVYDSALALTPAVAVYVDEVSLPFPLMARGAALDLERVEVLKGPQGTVFGDSSTGGAINYIAAKPTAHFASGGSLGLSNFGEADISAFVSGPLSNSLRARLAVQTIQGGAYQKSVTRPNDRLGNADVVMGRLLLDWTPTDRLTVSLNINGFLDRSDTVAGQLRGIVANPAAVLPALLTYPRAGNDTRSADWLPGWPNRRSDEFAQISGRIDYAVTDALTLTALSSYQHLSPDRYTSTDGTSLELQNVHSYGSIKSFNQEIRLSGASDALNWLVGANYMRANIRDNNEYRTTFQSTNRIFPDLAPFQDPLASLTERMTSYGLFGNADFKLTDRLSIQGGARYTSYALKGVNCGSDASAPNELGPIFERLQQIFVAVGLKTTPVVAIPQGACFVFDRNYDPAPYENRLKQDSLSWRFGLTYTLPAGGLVYLSQSRGYKTGYLPILSASTYLQYKPPVQERLDSYELGVKLPLFDRRLQVNAAAFYYDYRDKQIGGRTLDPAFGLLQLLVNVPKSTVKGGEVEVIAQPVDGLRVTTGVTYLDSKVADDFETRSQSGVLANFKGSRLPYTPKWTIVADAEYRFPVSGALDMVVGGGLSHHSGDNATFRTAASPADSLRIGAYTLVDLRAGLAAPDRRWQFTVWGRNITDTYYWTGVYQNADTLLRYAGRPATFGLTMTMRTP